jgi:hypothetical protein
MNSKQNKPNVYCIFTKAKDEPNTQIEKAFEIYLKNLLKTKDLSLDKNFEKD